MIDCDAINRPPSFSVYYKQILQQEIYTSSLNKLRKFKSGDSADQSFDRERCLTEIEQQADSVARGIQVVQ